MQDVETIPAATVVIFRHAQDGGAPELLMARRSRSLRFAPGMTVFPGGRIDPSDRDLAAQSGGDDPGELAARIAVIRETLEETGLLIGIDRPITANEAEVARRDLVSAGALGPVLASRGWRIDPSRLTPFARWHPRFAHSRSFDTRFYLHDLGTGKVTLAPDGSENTSVGWCRASDALAAADNGDVSIIYPTRRNLERLAQFASFAAAVADAEAHPIRPIAPEREIRDGREFLTIPEGLGYPVTAEPLDSAMRG